MNWLRWHAFRFLSWIGWAICPEPHRSRLQEIMPQWEDLEAELAMSLAYEFGAAEGDQSFGSRS